MPQMSPILWMLPITLLFFLLMTTKVSMAPTNEYEKKVSQKKNATSPMKWKW